jgi:hypothetical protein
LTYTLPEGWTDTGRKTQFAIAVFRVSRDGHSAEVRISPLGPAAGSLLGNVNRWRDELHLPAITEGQLAKESIKDVKVMGLDAKYVDILGPKARTLAVIVPRTDATWFFKMMGDPQVVADEKKAFEKFVQSVKFTGGRGGDHE